MTVVPDTPEGWKAFGEVNAEARERAHVAKITSLPVGTLVHVRYDFQPDIAALVCETKPEDKMFGWVMVEQITGYEVGERPRFLALATMITRKFGHEWAQDG